MDKVYGKDFSSLEVKHVESIFFNKYAPQSPYSDYNNIVQAQVTQAMNKVLSGQADINTALREAEEAANKAIAAVQSK
jgi:multiple sugar transport system substrate-binding protein